MTRFHSILVATDFSADATHAVRSAARLAEQHAARLTLLHVVSRTGFKPLRRWFTPSIDVDFKTAQARALFRQFAAEIAGRHGVQVRHRIVVGDAFNEILRASDAADLLVIGQRGTSPLKDLLIGSTADRLSRRCRCAMLIVKQSSEDPYRRVLLPVDFTVHSLATLRTVAALAPAAQLHVLHVLEASPRFGEQFAEDANDLIRDRRALTQKEAKVRVDQLIKLAEVDVGRAFGQVDRGEAWLSALHHERALDADLIAVGSRSSSTLADFVLGRVTRRVLAKSRSDVLIIPLAAAELGRVKSIQPASSRLGLTAENRRVA